MPFPDFWNAYWTFVSFVFGAIVGSFLNVCIWRLPRDESLRHPPSHCPACCHTLRLWPDMVPMASQLWYRSRCRYCGTRFSWRYFWVELLTACTFAALYLRYVIFTPLTLGETDLTWSAVSAMVFAAALITIFFIDLEHYSIPDAAVIVAVGAAVAKDALLIYRGVRPLSAPVLGTVPLPLSVVGGLVAFWLLWQFGTLASAAVGREAMGAGDYLLLGAMGAFLVPWPLVLLAFMLAVFFGTVAGVAGILLHQRHVRAAGAAPASTAGAAAGAEPAPELPPHPEGALRVESAAPVPALLHPDPAAGTVEDGAPAADTAVGPEARASGLEPDAAEHRCDRNGAAGVEPGAEPGEEPGAEPADEESHPAPGGEEIPEYPPGSRWGRVATVAGTWVAAGAVQAAAGLYRQSPLLGLGAGVLGAALAAGILVPGIRLWVRSDAPLNAAVDEYFEGDPGPRVIPFGPHLVVGALLAMLCGRPLVVWITVHVLQLDPSYLSGLEWD